MGYVGPPLPGPSIHPPQSGCEQKKSPEGNSMTKGLFATHAIEAMPHIDAGEPVEGSGTVIGAGIFVLTGTAAAQFAGPALVISFLMAGFACALAGLCYAEFAAMLPVSGSAYSYSYATLGEVVAWFVGWNLVLEYLFA